jgi:hypothetical protein
MASDFRRELDAARSRNLRATGLIGRGEIAAAIEEIDAVKEHLLELAQYEGVVDPGDARPAPLRQPALTVEKFGSTFVGTPDGMMRIPPDGGEPELVS